MGNFAHSGHSIVGSQCVIIIILHTVISRLLVNDLDCEFIPLQRSLSYSSGKRLFSLFSLSSFAVFAAQPSFEIRFRPSQDCNNIPVRIVVRNHTSRAFVSFTFDNSLPDGCRCAGQGRLLT